MVDGITGLTFLYLARHLALYSIKDSTGAFSIFSCCVELITVPCFFFNMRPSHYLQLAAAALICDNVPLPSVLLLQQHIF